MLRRMLTACVLWTVGVSPCSLFGQGASIKPLGPLEVATPYSYPLKVSPNGAVVVGEAFHGTDANAGYAAISWKATDPTRIFWSGNRSIATACSTNGDVVVGYDYRDSSNPYNFGWLKTPASGNSVTSLSSNSNYRSQPAACSADGSVIVGGEVLDANLVGKPFEATRWTQVNGSITSRKRLPKVGNHPSFAFNCTADGNLTCGITGWSGGTFACIWTEGLDLPAKIGSLDSESLYGVAYGCAAAKPIFVGASATEAGRIHAFLSYYGVLYDLGTIDGAIADSHAVGCSDDGFVAVGSVVVPGGFPPTACVWVDRTGYNLKDDLLGPAGVDLTGWSELNNVTDCSANGRTVVGAGIYNGKTTGFVATLPVFNQRPVARAGIDQTVRARTARGTRVRVDGRASFDPEGGPLTALWKSPKVTFTKDANFVTSALFPVGKTKVTLQVTDRGGRKDTDVMYVTVRLPRSSVRERGSFSDEVFAIAAGEAYDGAGEKEIDPAKLAGCSFAIAASGTGRFAGDVVEWSEGQSPEDEYLPYAEVRYQQLLYGTAAAHSLGRSLARTGDPATQQALFRTIQAVRHVAADLRTPIAK